MLNSQTEEIKSKIDIVDLIAEYIQLKQAGTNFKARCPFHNEKTPSFMVSREKQIWHCFGCGEGGDAFSFVQKIENIDFPEALNILAQKAGVKLKKLDPSLVTQKTRLSDITKLAAAFFHKALLESKEGQIARDYLNKRKLLPKTIKNFYLGYAPNSWDKLLNLLIKKGFKTNDIFLTGLVVKNDQGKLYDRFRQRLIFPIFDHNSTIVGFTARILDEEKPNQGGKYINTPQTLIYNKSMVIYGLNQSKQEIKKQDLAVIVEGNMDVIASHQAGIKNVIASSGTALTMEQLKILKRFSNNLALAFDADLAGQVAAQRGIDTALSLGINLRIIRLPEKINDQNVKDPDDCIRQGVKYWQEAIDQSVSIMDYYFDRVFKQYDKNDPQNKKEIASKLIKQIAKLTDKVEQDHWLSQLAQKIDVTENILQENFNALMETKIPIYSDIIFENTDLKNREHLLSEQILSLVIKYPKYIEYLINHLELEVISENNLQQIYKQLILYYNKDKKFDYSEFEKILRVENEKLVNTLSTLILLADKDFFDFTEKKIKQEIINIIVLLKKSRINNQLKLIEKQLKTAEAQNNQKQIQELSQQFLNLTQQLNNL